MMKKQQLIVFFMALISCLTAAAQETVFRNFSPTMYKGGTQNWDIQQMPDGQMAFANNNGVLVFDGACWSLFPIRNYSTVRSLHYDSRAGRLYAGASGEFGYYQLDPKTYRYRYHSLSDKLPAKHRNFGEIWTILPWKGQMVFQSKTHLFILDSHDKLRTSPSQFRIEAIAQAGGHLILATRHGLEEWRGNKSVPLPGATFDGNTVVRSLLPYGRQLLVATQQNGIMTYDGRQLHADNSELAPVLKSNQIFCAEMHGNRLAIGTVKAGLIVKDMRGAAPTLYINNSKGLMNNTVLSAEFDFEGNIWLGLDNGISCAITGVPFQNVVSERYSIGTGYTSIIYGDRLYMGTNQGLYMQTLPLQQQLVYKRPVPVDGISGQIWGLTTIDNALLCCADRGLYSIAGGRATRIDGPDGVWSLCPLKKHSGYVIAADYMGLVLLRRQGNTYTMAHRVATTVDVSGNLYEDTDGSLWMSNWQRGIYHMRLTADMKRATVTETYNSRNGLVMDQGNLLCKVQGKIYVSCVDGFYSYDRTRRRLVYDHKMSKVFNTYGTALKLTETPQHDLWAQKTDFLAIAHRHGNRYVVDSTSYRGIASTQQVGLGSMYAMPDAHSLVNSNDGFYLVNNHNNTNTHTNPLFISKITATNNKDSIVYRHAHNEEKGRTLTLPHSLNSVLIEFVSPEYMADDAIAYSYRLENYDTQWSSSETNSKEYTHLSKGTYTFHVKAYNRIKGTTQETSMQITVLPAWYESIWAYMVYVALAALVLYGGARYLKFRAERQLMIERTKRKAEMTQMQNEKLQTELKHKSSELASSTMSSIHQNDILQKLDDEMAMLSEQVRREDKKAAVTAKINEIRSTVQSYLSDDEGWEKFEENFNIVYDDFMKKLTSRYSNLKTSDRKLCAYLRMGLSSKEMAALLNMSVRSIETARYRLRKKLNLESGDNLTDFIQNFK